MSECPGGESHAVVAVQYGRTADTPYHYDGVSEYNYKTCNRRWGRFCGKRLDDGEGQGRADHEVEPPFCDGTKPHPKV